MSNKWTELKARYDILAGALKDLREDMRMREFYPLHVKPDAPAAPTTVSDKEREEAICREMRRIQDEALALVPGLVLCKLQPAGDKQ
jgi:hypothetical protein